jgi:hypothetical protein
MTPYPLPMLCCCCCCCFLQLPAQTLCERPPLLPLRPSSLRPDQLQCQHSHACSLCRTAGLPTGRVLHMPRSDLARVQPGVARSTHMRTSCRDPGMHAPYPFRTMPDFASLCRSCPVRRTGGETLGLRMQQVRVGRDRVHRAAMCSERKSYRAGSQGQGLGLNPELSTHPNLKPD